jgi:hypothetical protein
MKKYIEITIALFASAFIVIFIIEGMFTLDISMPKGKEHIIMTYTSTGEILDVFEVKGKIKQKDGVVSFDQNGKKIQIHGEYLIKEK